MGLSTHELWLVLRARDEATRVLRNVMTGMQKEHTNVINSQIDEVRGLMAASNDSYNAQREQIVKTIKTAQVLNHESQTRISEIGRERDAVLRAIGDERDDIRLVINDKQDEIRESRYRISELGRERDAAISALNDESGSLVKASKLRSLLNDDAIADIDRRVIETARAHKAELSQLSGLVSAKQREITITDRQIKKIGIRTQRAVDGLKREKLSIQELGAAADAQTLQRLSQIGREITSTQLLSREKIRALNKAREAQLKNLDLAKANLDFAEKGNKAELDAINAKRDELIKVGKVDVEQTKLSVEALKTRERAIRDTTKLEIQSLNEGIDAKRKDIDLAQSQISVLGERGTAARNAAKVEIDGLNKVIETRRADIDASHAQIETIKKAQKESNATYKKRIANLQDEMDKADEVHAKHKRTIGQLQNIGAGFVTAGAGAGIFGVAVEAGLYTAAKGFIEYQQKAAKSFTQVDNHGETSMQHIIDMGYRVAKEIPVAFEQIQPAIYDIFSSMEVTTTEQGERILNAMAKGAVGALTDIQTVTQTTVGIMNAYGLAAEDAIKVNDFMFQLVRKGVGDYDQFGASIGKVIPSAQRANQSYEEIGAALAFLTRNGTNAANAGTYVARTMDAIANAKTEANFKKVGMSVRDVTGQFKPMSQIMDEIKTKTKDMSAPDKASFVQNLFKGSGGTIQSMKAINLMLGEHSDLYKTMQTDMQNAGGAAEDAYNIMKDTPAAKIQDMKNQWELVGQAVGLAALPALMSIAEAIKGVADWFNSLDPDMQKAITNFALIGGAVSILMGFLVIVAGGIMMVFAGVLAVGIPVAATIGGIVLAIGLVIAIIIILIAFWPQISAAAQAAWEAVVKWANEAWVAITEWWAGLGPWFQALWDSIVLAVQTTWAGIVEFFTTLWTNIVTLAQTAWDGFVAYLAGVWAAIVAGVSDFIAMIVAPFQPLLDLLNIVLPLAWDYIKSVIAGAFLLIVGIVTGDSQLINDTMQALSTKLTAITDAMWGAIIKFFIDAGMNIKRKVDEININVNNALNDAWNKVKTAAENAWRTFSTTVAQWLEKTTSEVKAFPGKAASALASLAADIGAKATAAWQAFLTATANGVANAISEIKALPGKAASALANTGSALVSAGTALITGFVNGIKDAAQRVYDAARGVVEGAIRAAKAALGMASPSKVFRKIGFFSGEGLALGLLGTRDRVATAGEIMVNSSISNAMSQAAMFKDVGIVSGQNLVKGLLSMESQVAGAAGRMNAAIALDTALNNGSVVNNGTGLGGGVVNVEVNTQEIDPVKHAADLGYEISARLGSW